jgi:2-polyprenyl-3-methyl-5-hydroxy-6-metoxy-1,4-benzoquinol methylase
MTSKTEMRFGFGRNWQRFLDQHYAPERVEIARLHLLSFLQLPDLSGKSFLDIGCGSGIHSLAAYRSGAKKIISFDYDPESVAATRSLHAREGSPKNWEIYQGSALDAAYCRGLGQFDIVYSWGVLHHTGDQWTGIRNAAGCVAPDGRMYIALYTTEAHNNPSPDYWLDIKQRYNRAGCFTKRWMELVYLWRSVAHRDWRQFLALPKFAAAYRKNRGMALMTDVRDWLGGWPMEFSSLPEVIGFADTELDMDLAGLSTGEANNEYLFVRRGMAPALGLPSLPGGMRVALSAPVASPADLPSGKPIVIFGTSPAADLLYADLLHTPGARVVGFGDIRRDGDLHHGLPVYHINKLPQHFGPDTVIVISNRYVWQNGARLWLLGFRSIFDAGDWLKRLMAIRGAAS